MPTNKDRALAAHCHVLGLAASMPDGIDMSAEPVGRWVALALLARLLHLGEAIHRLVDERFGDAVEPLARAMTSASISIVTIVDGDSDNRALAFLAETIRARRKRLRAIVEHGLMDQQAADAHETAANANDHAVPVAVRGHGCHVRRLLRSDARNCLVVVASASLRRRLPTSRAHAPGRRRS